MAERYYGCVEAGGTKMVCAVAAGPDDIRARARIATTTPDATLAAVHAFFADHAPALAALGVASFGPVELDRASPAYGRIVRTPKPGWSGFDMAGAFARYGVPVGFDTDVNGALLGEARWGAARGCTQPVYLTIGTGIGGGALVGGLPVHGAGHPEMGHARPPRHPDDHAFAGLCPYHGDCYEGLASGPAIHARWGEGLSTLPADHPAHAIVAFYLGQLCADVVAMLAPDRIILGGGVTGAPGLLDRVRAAADAAGGGYHATPPGQRVVAPGLGDRSGLAGAIVLAQRALETAR